MNLRAKKKAMWQEGLDIYICVCVTCIIYIYISIYLYLYIYLFIHTHYIQYIIYTNGILSIWRMLIPGLWMKNDDPVSPQTMWPQLPRRVPRIPSSQAAPLPDSTRNFTQGDTRRLLSISPFVSVFGRHPSFWVGDMN